MTLNIDAAGKQLYILSGTSADMGREPKAMTIVRNDPLMIVGVRIEEHTGDVYVVRLRRETGNAVWGKVGGSAISVVGDHIGWAHYMECS